MEKMLDSFSRQGRKLKDRLKGGKHKRDGKGADTAGERDDPSGSFLRPEPHVTTGGHDGEGNRTSTGVSQVDPSPSVPSIPYSGEPEGTSNAVILVTVSDRSDNADTSAVPARVSEDPRPNENNEPKTTADEKKSNWRSTAFATARLLLHEVRESADAFGPLKAVAGGLCFILENCEVRASSRTYCPRGLHIS